jgi:poly [ADP-ribose] polymerase
MLEKMLIFVSGANNNNKFYHVKYHNNVITTRYGRVGSDGVSSSTSGTEANFNSVIKAKIRKGYVETPIVPSEIETKTNTGSVKLSEVAKKTLTVSSGDRMLEALIDKLAAQNQHDIINQSGGLITVNSDGLIRTPLGLVDVPAINEAEKVLSSMKQNFTPTQLDKYLTLVPQKVPHGRGWQDTFISSDDDFTKQQEFLNQLRQSINWYQDKEKAAREAVTDDDTNTYDNLFKYKLSAFTDADKAEFQRVDRFFRSHASSRHTSYSLKLKNIYRISDPHSEFDSVAKKLGNVKELWHGTRVYNVMSILSKGLFIPSASGSGIKTNGRMFGDGVYLSDQSTKSLNYSQGYWDRSAPRDNNCFMFLTDVAMGTEFHPKSSGYSAVREAYSGKNRLGKPFNSINVKGGTAGVMNNEMIVWNLNQINLKYLCEFSA